MIPIVFAGPFKVRAEDGTMTHEFALGCPDCGKRWIFTAYEGPTIKAAQRYINKHDVHICAPK